MEFNSPIEFINESGSFLSRPSVIGSDGSVSGIGLRQENFYVDTATLNAISTGVAFDDFRNAGLTTHSNAGAPGGVWAVAVTQNVKLYPHFSISALHDDASSFEEWIVRLYKNATPVASGWFKWDATESVHKFTWGTWMTDGDVTFDAGLSDRWGLSIDNDGSGTSRGSPFNRVHIGFTILDNYPD